MSDSHQSVDSGFSSSSPESPKGEEPDQNQMATTESDATKLSPPHHALPPNEQPTPSFIPSKDESVSLPLAQPTAAASLGPSNNHVADVTVKQELIEQSYGDQSKAVSVVIPRPDSRMNGMGNGMHTTSVSSLPLQPVNDYAEKVSNQSMTIHSVGQAPAGEANQLQTALASLANQITGGATVGGEPMNGHPEVKVDEEANDLSSLIRNNKVAEPPACGCINRSCELSTSPKLAVTWRSI